MRSGEHKVLYDLLEYLPQTLENPVDLEAAPAVQVAAARDGAVWVGGYVRGPVTVGRINRVLVEPDEGRFGAYVVHLNSDNQLLCE